MSAHTPLTAEAIELLGYLNEAETAAVTAQLILMWGMTPTKPLTVPPSVAGVSWAACWRAGLGRLAASGAAALT